MHMSASMLVRHNDERHGKGFRYFVTLGTGLFSLDNYSPRTYIGIIFLWSYLRGHMLFYFVQPKICFPAIMWYYQLMPWDLIVMNDESDQVSLNTMVGCMQACFMLVHDLEMFLTLFSYSLMSLDMELVLSNRRSYVLYVCYFWSGNRPSLSVECPKCKQYFCIDCDIYIHESLHNCPGCESFRHFKTVSSSEE